MPFARNKKIKLKFYGLLFFLSGLGLTLLLLPADFFDQGQSICISVLLLDKECYGCGMTRAVQHLIHFDFNAAWQYNKLSFVVLPLFIGMFIWELKRLFISMKATEQEKEI
jgi:hypothetical protein